MEPRKKADTGEQPAKPRRASKPRSEGPEGEAKPRKSTRTKKAASEPATEELASAPATPAAPVVTPEPPAPDTRRFAMPPPAEAAPYEAPLTPEQQIARALARRAAASHAVSVARAVSVGVVVPIEAKTESAPPPEPEPEPTPEPAPEPVRWRVQPLPPPADVMPYFPSAPCATCATGVDPLRAAVVRATERGLAYYCSRTCREAQQRSLVARNEAPAPPVRPLQPSLSVPPVRPAIRSVPPSRPAPRSLEPVARRIEPGRASTPIWPLAVATLCASLPWLDMPLALETTALAVVVAAAVFASRSNTSRAVAGTLAWLAPAFATGLLAVASLLGETRVFMVSAALGLVVAWFREHWLERGEAHAAALRAELEARGAARVRVSSSDGRIGDRALHDLRVGDCVSVEQGSVVPVDGVIEVGSAELLPYPQARITIARREGGAVLAGALVISGSLQVRATAVATRRALFRALVTSDRHLERAAPSSQLAQRMRGAAPAIAAVIAAFSLLAPGPVADKLAAMGAAALLLPMLAASRGVVATLQEAVIRASSRGVLFRDGAALERAGHVDTALLRVEGTLVPRSYTLVEVHALSPDVADRDELLGWALATEAAAEAHPIARAVRRHASSLGIEAPLGRRLSYAPGAGVSGITDGQGAVVFGSRAALLQAGVSVAVADREAQQAEQQGHKVVLLAIGGHVRGVFVFAQEMRPESRLAVQSLFDLGLEVELVSGDHRNTIEALARTLDVLQLKAELSREQREAEVRRLRDGEARVAVIGNAEDAGGMLTSADVGICLEGAPDVHTPGDLRAVSYDVITASPDLCDAAYALEVARHARRSLQRVWVLSVGSAVLAVLTASAVVPGWAAAVAALALDGACMFPRDLRPSRREPRS